MNKDSSRSYDEFTKSELYQDLTRGTSHAAVRALEIFDESKEAMLKEMIIHPRAGFYQIILMMAEAIAHEEMAIALNSTVDVVLDEIFKLHKNDTKGKTAQEFKDDLKNDLRGDLDMAKILDESGFENDIRRVIRSSIT